MNDTNKLSMEFKVDPPSDKDGIPNAEDNCPYKPNGYELGSCSPWSGSPGVVCESDNDCTATCTGVRACNKNQEDTDNDGVGDVCDNCYNNCNSLQKDADGDGIGDVCDPTPGCGGCSGIQCETSCGTSTTTTMITTTTSTTTSIITPPPEPSNLTATALSSSEIRLTWNDNSSNETGFRIEEALSSGGPWTLLPGSILANWDIISKSGLNPSTTYYYRMYAYNAGGNSAYSNIAYATTLNPGCVSPTSISVGQTVNGNLVTTDCNDSSMAQGAGYYTDRYSFDGNAGQQVYILLTSTVFDTFLYLRNPSGTVIEWNDDGGGFWNSRIPADSGYYSLPSSGRYTIEVTSWQSGKTGSYTILLNQ